VGGKLIKVSIFLLKIFSYLIIACFHASNSLLVSSDRYFGLKNGTLAPYFSEIFAISLQSVETIISFTKSNFFARSMACTIKGLPEIFRIFFLEPL
jgi:hypothetical protein